MRPELTAAFVAPFVAGLFGLVPLVVQVATTRAQRKDRMTGLDQLRAELEFLERLHALEGKVAARGEAAKPRTDVAIGEALSDLWDRYGELSESTPSSVIGGKPSSQQRSFLRRVLLLYTPRTSSGWILHTLFYTLAIVVGFVLIASVGLAIQGVRGASLGILAIYGAPFTLALLIVGRRARRNAARDAGQSAEPGA